MKHFIILMSLLFTTSLFAVSNKRIFRDLKTEGLVVSGPSVSVKPERTVKIIGAIDIGLLEQAKKIRSLAVKSKKPIYIIINSPGGGVYGGYMFIDAMHDVQSRGIEIRCFVGSIAMSMAFNILMECDSRYSYENSLLMFHPVRVSGGALTARQMRRLAPELQALDNRMLEVLDATVDMSRYKISKAFYLEHIWTSWELNEKVDDDFITIVKRIDGVSDAVSFRKPFSFFMRGNTKRKYFRRDGNSLIILPRFRTLQRLRIPTR